MKNRIPGYERWAVTARTQVREMIASRDDTKLHALEQSCRAGITALQRSFQHTETSMYREVQHLNGKIESLSVKLEKAERTNSTLLQHVESIHPPRSGGDEFLPRLHPGAHLFPV